MSDIRREGRRTEDGVRVKGRLARRHAQRALRSSLTIYCSNNCRIAAIRSCNRERPFGAAICSRHGGGRKLSCVHSSTAAMSCSSFSSPCADGMNSASACFNVGPLDSLRAGRQRRRFWPSTMLSMSAPLSRRSASTGGMASSAKCELVLLRHRAEHLADFVRLVRIKKRDMDLSPPLPLEVDRQAGRAGW